MKYLPIFTLYLNHAYYADQRCSDFRLAPTPATQRLLDNFRCILKPFPNGIRILTTVADDGAPLIPLQKGMTFAFQLWLQNANFALFTDLTELAGIAAPVYTNDQVSAGDPVELTLVSRQAWATERFTVRQPNKAEVFALSGRPLIDLPAAAMKVAGLGQVSSPAHYDATARVITVDSSAASIGDVFEITYAITPRRANGVFAEVAITYRDTAPSIAAAPGVFQINFAAKSARWHYYIVTDSAPATFRIEDQDKQAPLVFRAAPAAVPPDQSDPVATTLAQQYPKMQLLHFSSDALVQCQQTARKSLQLFLEDNPAISALPNPSLRNYTLDAKSGNPPGEYALFHVVTFFTQLISTSGG